MRLRRWFGTERSVSMLDLAFARFGEPGERRPRSPSRSRRETLHPLQGWREETRDGLMVVATSSPEGLRPPLTQFVKNRIQGRRFPS